tara:strand:- start:2741 stop:3568 length:828 start_codon:yes stop_codon:yes gene_type:complete
MYKVFINIASYRDTDLIHTVEDAYDKAKNPDNLFIGISEQDESHNSKIDSYSNISYTYRHYSQSKGTGWHRNEINKNLYGGEDFTLTIDSHSRFKKEWDVQYIDKFLSFDNNVILTGFPPHFDFDEEYDKYTGTRKINTFNVPKRINKESSISAVGKHCETEYKETVVVSGANIFSSGMFNQLSTYNHYLHPFLDQEIVCCLAYMYNHTVMYSKEALVWHCYRNNLPDSKEKYRPLVSEDVQISGFDRDIVRFFNTINSPRKASEWREYILNYKL